ncbi:hypothetical protein LSAT2_014336 [Lamellibrachia satsuma]|nr:hypothetical protein LSAT2_014336 [Lamellibrachia satsuma]
MKISLTTSLVLVSLVCVNVRAGPDGVARCYIKCYLQYDQCMHTCPLNKGTTYTERHRICSEWRESCFKMCREVKPDKALVPVD